MGYKIRKILTDNLGLKMLALILAIVIWWFVMNQNDPVRSMIISNVPITIVNEESIADIGKVVEPEGSGTVNVKVTERRSILNRLARNGSNFYVEADLENINEMNAVPLTVVCDNSAVTWDEISISPTSLKVSTEDKTEQQFAVNVSLLGDVASGYAIGSTEVVGGKTILIAGPQSLVGIINQVTAPVSVSGLSADSALTSTLRIYDKNGAELTEAQMNRLELKDSYGDLLSERTVDVNIDLWRVKNDIRLHIETVGRPAEGYWVSDISTVPETIQLAGTEEALERLGGQLTVEELISVDNASEQIIREIDLNDTISRHADLKFVNESDNIVTVTVRIEKTGDISLDIPLADIEMLNKPSDMKLVFTPADKINVRVQSLEGGGNTISSSDLEASVDLSACSSEGTYELPVDITLPEGFELSADVVLKVVSAGAQTEALTEGEAQNNP